MSDKLTRTVEHEVWMNMKIKFDGLTIAECARRASEYFGDPGPWIVSDEHCKHTVKCERVCEWRCVDLREDPEGDE
jgi:hypothetical protein